MNGEKLDTLATPVELTKEQLEQVTGGQDNIFTDSTGAFEVKFAGSSGSGSKLHATKLFVHMI
jgi:hypothetical protein